LEGKDRSGAQRWTDEEFYANGERHWSECEPAWRRFGYDGSGACLEIGCGAGRMTWPLAPSFRRVFAIDVSPEMIAYARKRPRADNVEFLVTSGITLPLADASVRAVFSTFVFQHFDEPRDGLAYFREIRRTLQPGGTLMIQLPLYRWPAPNGTLLDRLERSVLAATHHGRLALARTVAAYRRRNGAPVMRAIKYDCDQLGAGVRMLGVSGVEVAMGGEHGLTWLFARL
jgi:ubiquinone/menaquinone biosynthesis C-methylase UbiE